MQRYIGIRTSEFVAKTQFLYILIHQPAFLSLTFLISTFRLDAGTFGTMGVGLGFAIATALYARDNDPGARVLCVEGF